MSDLYVLVLFLVFKRNFLEKKTVLQTGKKYNASRKQYVFYGRDLCKNIKKQGLSLTFVSCLV